MDSRAGGARGGPVPLAVPIPPLHLITDDRVVDLPDFLARAETALRAGGGDVGLHLRAHGHAGGPIHRTARRLRAVCDRHGASLWVNDRVDVALAVRVDGVQVGRRGLPLRDVRALVGTSARIGFSAHSADEAQAALSEGADAVILGPVYATASHPGGAPCGLDVLAEAAGVSVPVVAIGGITPGRLREVRARGAAGLAVLGGVWNGPPDGTGDRVAAYLEAWCGAA